MTEQEKKALNEAKASATQNLSDKQINVNARKKPFVVGETSYVVVDKKLLLKGSDDSFNGNNYIRLEGVGISLKAFTEIGCIYDKAGKDITTGNVVDTMAAVITSSGVAFEDGQKINLKVKDVVPVVRGGQPTSRIVWQLV